MALRTGTGLASVSASGSTASSTKISSAALPWPPALEGDPTSENETLTNAFDRKTIALDRAYIAYNPVSHSWLSLTAGKFPYLWQRTSVTGDPDLNPEGFDQKLSFNYNSFVQNLSFQTFELLYNDSSTGHDSYVLGAQAQARFKAGSMDSDNISS